MPYVSCMWKYCGLLLMFAMLACTQGKPNKPTSFVDPLEPVYGAISPIRGTYIRGVEDMRFYPCADARRKCVSSYGGVGCSAVFTTTASAEMSRLLDQSRSDASSGEYWLEGTGRITRLPGRFGHLGVHSCQIEVSSVKATDGHPPWAFRPPPPLERRDDK